MQNNVHNCTFEWSLLGLYALLLAIVTARHQLWSDEMQMWLIARDNPSLAGLFHAMSIEPHPALWYLILSALAHISWNPIGMQIVNYVFAITEAWLILSARKLHLVIRVLFIFSFFVFHNYAVVARNYMLALLLLTAAVRCLLGDRQHRKLAILFLALSINTHILAIPIAVAIALWAFCFSKLGSSKDTRKLLRDAEFWTASLVLLASVAIAYTTVVHPAQHSPLAPQTQSAGQIAQSTPAENHSLTYNTLVVEGTAWTAFFPVESDHLPAGVSNWLDMNNPSFSPLASGMSFVLFLLITLALRTYKARMVFVAGTTLLLVTLAITPKEHSQLRYVGFIFIAFLLALMIDAYTTTGASMKSLIPRTIASALLLSILIYQATTGIYASVGSTIRPYSDARSVGVWLKNQGLDKNPMVIDGYSALAVLGYLERPPVYLTSCRCFHSYALFDSKYDPERRASLDDLSVARGNSSLPVVLLIAYRKLDGADLQKLGLTEIHIPETVSSRGTFTVYEQVNP
jgi:hypothetical protein